MAIKLTDAPAPRRLAECPARVATTEEGALIHAAFLAGVEDGIIPRDFGMNVRTASSAGFTMIDDQAGETEAFSDGVIWVHVDLARPPAVLGRVALHEVGHVGFLLMPGHEDYRLGRIRDAATFRRLNAESEAFACAFAARWLPSAPIQAAIRRLELARAAGSN